MIIITVIDSWLFKYILNPLSLSIRDYGNYIHKILRFSLDMLCLIGCSPDKITHGCIVIK